MFLSVWSEIVLWDIFCRINSWNRCGRGHSEIFIFMGIAKVTSKEFVAVHAPVPMCASPFFPTSELSGILIHKNGIPGGILICNFLLMSKIEHRE